MLECAATKLDAAAALQHRDRALRRMELLRAQGDGVELRTVRDVEQTVASLWPVATRALRVARRRDGPRAAAAPARRRGLFHRDAWRSRRRSDDASAAPRRLDAPGRRAGLEAAARC